MAAGVGIPATKSVTAVVINNVPVGISDEIVKGRLKNTRAALTRPSSSAAAAEEPTTNSQCLVQVLHIPIGLSAEIVKGHLSREAGLQLMVAYDQHTGCAVINTTIEGSRKIKRAFQGSYWTSIIVSPYFDPERGHGLKLDKVPYHLSKEEISQKLIEAGISSKFDVQVSDEQLEKLNGKNMEAGRPSVHNTGKVFVYFETGTQAEAALNLAGCKALVIQDRKVPERKGTIHSQSWRGDCRMQVI